MTILKVGAVILFILISTTLIAWIALGLED